MGPDDTNWPPPRALAIGYTIAISALIINAALTFWYLSAVQTTWETLSGGRDFLRGIDNVRSDLEDAETGQRGFLLTGDERYLEPYTKSHAVILASIARLRSLAGDNESRHRRLNVIASASAAKLSELENSLTVRRRDGLDAAIASMRTDSGKNAMDRVRSELAAMRAEEDASRASLRSRLQAAITRTTLTFSFASALALALLFGVHLLSKHSREQLRREAAWLSTTLRSIGDAVIATNGLGRVIFMNGLAEKLTAWTTDEARGKPLSEVFRISNEDTGSIVEGPVPRVLREGMIVGLASSTILTAKDGTARPIENSGAPIKDDGRVQGVVLVFRDASETREAERRIRESEERYRSLVAATTHTVWIASPDFRSSSTLTGQDPVGLPGEANAGGGWLDDIHPEDREPTRRAFAHALRGRAIYEIEHRVRSRDDTFRHYLVRALPLLDKAGAIREWIGTSTDITDRKHAQEARDRLFQEIEANDKRKDEFLAMLAHELRNPIAAIANSVMLATHSGLQEHIDWSMEVINRQIKHLTRLIDDLLDVSRINRGKIELRRHVLDVTPVIDNAIESARPLMAERRHELSVSLERGNLWVDVDPTRLEQVVINLLTNAAKYTENGGHIWLSAGHDDGDVVITVKDTGVGIPPDKLPEMFELFAQGDRTLARSEGGLGIGLTVVRKLAEAHGGQVTAWSAGIDKGSEFSVRLPAARRPDSGEAQAIGPAEPTDRPARILIVDDNVDMAKGMAKLLRLLGHDVQTAYNGREAIDMARICRPEVVLLDIGLPVMDGFAVVEMLRQDGSCANALFIAISGYGQDEDRRRSREAGFDDHLVKPIDYHALLKLLSPTEASHSGAS
jgi:PAS domain S-box-containing protein